MSQSFDPYRIWLGIPPEEQPPNHYRLLGIGLFESDPDVISNAADRQMTHVRTFQTGPHSALSQKLMNELAAARVMLLDPARRRAYEERLRRELAGRSTAEGVRPKGDGGEAVFTADSEPAVRLRSRIVRRQNVSRKQWTWLGRVTMAAVVVLGVTALVWLLKQFPAQQQVPPAPPRGSGTKTASKASGEPSHPVSGGASKSQTGQPTGPSGMKRRSGDDRAIPAAPSGGGDGDLSRVAVVAKQPSEPSPSLNPGQPAAKANVAPQEANAKPGSSPKPPPSDQPVSPKLDRAALAKIKGFECRHEPARSLLLAALGGNDASQKAVDRAVDWLVKHQLPEDGRWDFDRIGASANPGRLGAPHTATALAVLALAGAGQGDHNAEHRTSVFKGAQYLVKQMKAASTTGSLYENSPAELPSHAIATVALCEVGAVGHNRAILDVAKSAVTLIVRSQNKDGGWASALPISEKDPIPSELYATGWSIVALSTARTVRLEVPESTLERAGVFLDSLEIRNQLVYRRGPSQAPDPNATPIGFLARMCLEWRTGEPEVRQYLDRLVQSGPRTDGNLNYNYHATLLLRSRPGSAWNAWNLAIRDGLTAQQVQEGPDVGSWYFATADELVRQGGRLYSTAMATLILESYYRYPPPPTLLDVQ